MLWLVKMSVSSKIIPHHLLNLKFWERKLRKDSELRKRYADTIKEHAQRGYIASVEPQDPRSRQLNREWYLRRLRGYRRYVILGRSSRPRRNSLYFFMPGGSHIGCGSPSVHSIYNRRPWLIDRLEICSAKTANGSISTYSEAASVVAENF